MPVLYSVRQSTIANKEGKKLFHPQVKTTGTVTLDTLAEEVAELSSLSPGDVKNGVDNLISVMTRHMQSGESVMLGDLGPDGLPKDTRTPAQRTALLHLLQDLHRRYPPGPDRSPRRPRPRKPHCPGFNVVHEYRHLQPNL